MRPPRDHAEPEELVAVKGFHDALVKGRAAAARDAGSEQIRKRGRADRR
jgi:hypothetical protein